MPSPWSISLPLPLPLVSSRIPAQVYARAALLSYHALVPDMATCVQDLVASLEAKKESAGRHVTPCVFMLHVAGTGRR